MISKFLVSEALAELSLSVNFTSAVSSQSDSAATTGSDCASADGDEPPSRGYFGPSNNNRVDLTLLTDDTNPSVRGYLDRHLAQVARLAGVKRYRISVALVDDTSMTSLHKQFRLEESTTDVLTFDLGGAGLTAGALEGDIAVCKDQAERQAAQRGHDVRAELLLYCVHGLLHLMDYDDRDPKDAARMHDREDELLELVGVGRIYQSEGKSS